MTATDDGWVSLAKDDGNFAGYLKKQGEKGLIKGWKNRWFVLNRQEGRVYYYKTEDSPTPLNFIDMAWVTSIFSTSRSETEFAIKMHENSQYKGRVFILQALTRQDMETWVLYLKMVKDELESGSTESQRILAVERRSDSVATPSAAPAAQSQPTAIPARSNSTTTKADVGDWARTSLKQPLVPIGTAPSAVIPIMTRPAANEPATQPIAASVSNGYSGSTISEGFFSTSAPAAKESMRQHRRAMLLKKNEQKALEQQQKQKDSENIPQQTQAQPQTSPQPGPQPAAQASATQANSTQKTEPKISFAPVMTPAPAVPTPAPTQPQTPPAPVVASAQPSSTPLPPQQSTAISTTEAPKTIEGRAPSSSERPTVVQAPPTSSSSPTLVVPSQPTRPASPSGGAQSASKVEAAQSVPQAAPAALAPQTSTPTNPSPASISSSAPEKNPAASAATSSTPPTEKKEKVDPPRSTTPTQKPPRTRVQDISDPNLVVAHNNVPTSPLPVIVAPAVQEPTPEEIERAKQRRPASYIEQVISVEAFKSILVEVAADPDLEFKLKLGPTHSMSFSKGEWKLLSDSKVAELPEPGDQDTATWKLPPNFLVQYRPESGEWLVSNFATEPVMRPSWNLEEIVDRLEARSILTQLQKGMLLNLYKEVHVIQRMYERNLSKIPAPTEEEKREILDEAKNPDVSLVIRSAFCTAVACIFADQFNPFSFFGSRSLWDFVYAAATNKSSGADPTALTLMKAAEFIQNDRRLDDEDERYRCFITTGLNHQCLFEWVSELLRNKKECSRFYDEGALVFVAPTLIADAFGPLGSIPCRLSYIERD